MSKLKYDIIAWVIAVALTALALSQTLTWHTFPGIYLVFWFPLIVFGDAIMGYPNVLVELALSLIQFPLFAICFSIGIRRSRVLRVVAVTALVYALLVLVAFVVYMIR